MAEKAVLSGGLLLVAVSATAPVVPIGIGLFALLAAVAWARVPWRTFVAAWTGPLISGWLIANFGGFSTAAVAIATVYILSLVAAPFLPETRGKPLPE